MPVAPDLPNFRFDRSPKRSKFVSFVEFVRSLIPISGRGIHASRSSGGTIFSLAAPDSPRWAKATEAIAAPTFDGTDLAPDTGSITFLVRDGVNSTLGTESVTARNCLVGTTGVSSGNLVLAAYIDDRWDIIGRQCS